MRPAAPDRRRGVSAEGGFATVLALGWVALFVVVAAVGLSLAVGVARQHQVDGAADLAALSAAAALNPGNACRIASTVAAANAVELANCVQRGGDVVITVRAQVVLPFGLRPWVQGQARAGPG